jgi:hypothetical protein
MSKIQFNQLAIGVTFYMNGNYYMKRSTRTAYSFQHCKTFYFKQKDMVDNKDYYN